MQHNQLTKLIIPKAHVFCTHDMQEGIFILRTRDFFPLIFSVDRLYTGNRHPGNYVTIMVRWNHT